MVSDDSRPQPDAPRSSPRGKAGRLVLTASSVGLTALLVGAAITAWFLIDRHQRQLRDPAFLAAQLEQVGGGQAESGPRPMRPALVRVAEVRKGSLAPIRAILGRLIEIRRSTIAGETSGKIIDMPVEEGSLVTANETVLARIDDVWARLTLQQSEHEIRALEIQLDYEQRQLDRLHQLAEEDRGAISATVVEEQEELVENLKVQINVRTTVRDEAKLRVERSVVYSPFDAVVVRRMADLGQHVSPGASIVEVVERGQVDAEIHVPESLIDRISLGQTLTVSIPPLNLEVEGPIVAIVPYGPTASRTFPVRIRLDDRDGRLKVGMSVKAFVPEITVDDALIVHKDALLSRPDGETLWLAREGDASEGDAGEPSATAVNVPVRVLAVGREMIAVEPELDADAALLADGAQAIVEGAERLTQDQPIRVVELDARHAENLPTASGHTVIETP